MVADLSLPVSKGANIAWALKEEFPKVKVIILSIHNEKAVVDDLMAAGVEGIVLKNRAVIDLIPAIREVLARLPRMVLSNGGIWSDTA